MNRLFIFLILVISGYLLFSCKRPNKESFSLKHCNTLRCQNNKYSATSLKNTLHNNLTTVSSGYITNAKAHLSNFKDRWL